MDRKKEVEQIVTSFLPKEEGYQKTVLEAMNYSIRRRKTTSSDADA